MIRVDVQILTRTSFRMRREGDTEWIMFRWNSTLDPYYPEQSGTGTYIVGGKTREDAIRSAGRVLKSALANR